MPNIGSWVSNTLGFDPTPGFNLSRSNGAVYPAASGTTSYLGAGAAKTQLANTQINNNGTIPSRTMNEVQGDTLDLGGAYSGDGSGSGTSAADAQERAAVLFAIDQGVAGAQEALARLDRQRDIGFGNIDRDYSYELDALTGNRSKNLDRYKQQEVDQLNQYQAKRSNNNMSATNWLMGARNTLGSQGAGGGSTSRYRLPYEAQTQAAGANAGDQAINNQNMQAIAGSRNQDEDQFTNATTDLNRQRDQGRNDFTSNIENQRVQLLNQLGGLQGQRAIANGGDFRAAQAAANPYTSKISALMNQIDSLAATPAIKARQVTLGRPDLSGYNWARPQAAPVAQQDPTLSGQPVYAPAEDDRNPILSLFGLDDRQYA